METYFECEALKTLDIRTILDTLKRLEHDLYQISKEAGNGNKGSQAKLIKYRFMPVETHQMMEFQGKKTDEEFKSPNMQTISDDDEPIMQFTRQTNLEQHRMYNKYELQLDMKSDGEEEMPARGSGGGTREFQYPTREMPMQIKGSASGQNVMEWLLKECGLHEDSLKKLKDQQINESNIGYLSYDDLKNLGLPLGPARQLYGLISKLKRQSKDGSI